MLSGQVSGGIQGTFFFVEPYRIKRQLEFAVIRSVKCHDNNHAIRLAHAAKSLDKCCDRNLSEIVPCEQPSLLLRLPFPAVSWSP
jgi:hypothetical protein